MCGLFPFGMDMHGVLYTSISQTLYTLNILCMQRFIKLDLSI